MGFIIGALKVLILLDSLIVLHEFGHYIVSKALGVKVLKFAIGFGPKLFKKQGKETEFSIRAIPIGGFVQLEGEMDAKEGDKRAFSNQPAYKKILILLAGVFFNIVLALFIYLCIYMNVNDYLIPKILKTPTDSITATYGFNKNDEILKINGETIYNAYDIERIVTESKSNNFRFLIKDENRNKKELDIIIPDYEIGYIGVAFLDKEVYKALSNSAGFRAGLREGDVFKSIDGKTFDKIDDYLEIIKSSPEKPLLVEVVRDAETVKLTLTPDTKKVRTLDLSYIELKDLQFIDNFKYAIKETKYYLRSNIIGISQLLTGNTQNVEVSGIVGASKEISNTKTIQEFFYMMSAISLSLGIMNLIPIPGLDGGKILIILIEVIRGKELSIESQVKITLIGFTILIGLMIFTTVNDVLKL